MSSPVDFVADWNARLGTRLYEQFKGKPKLLALVAACAKQFQDIEDAAQTILSVASIADSEGIQLDNLGRIVGQPRNGVDDPAYRLYLAARILANKSSGTSEQLIAIMIALFGPDALVTIQNGGDASFSIRVGKPLTPMQAGVGTQFVTDSKAAGVRANFEWQQVPDAQAFYTADADTLSAPASMGSSTLAVTGAVASSWPQSGSVILDYGLANAETVGYSSISGGGTTINLSAPLANNHDERSSVERSGDLGLGFGDSSNPTVGGALSGAAAA